MVYTPNKNSIIFDIIETMIIEIINDANKIMKVFISIIKTINNMTTTAMMTLLVIINSF